MMNDIVCPYAKSDMTPCAARDGKIACADDGVCVGCGQHPAELLRDLVAKYIELKSARQVPRNKKRRQPAEAAD
jgi:hypothetical protein